MSNYFQHDFISNSDLKDFKKKVQMVREDPPNLQQIFDLGSLFHAAILEPHLKEEYRDKVTPDEWDLTMRMRDTFWTDPVCRAFVMAPDFHRETPFFNENAIVGPYRVKLRCKTDGVRPRIKMYLELKGLKAATEKAFRDAIINNDYDQATAHYMHTGDFDRAMIVGISKTDPTKLFKWWVKKFDDFFLGGEQKMIDTLTLLRDFSPDDVMLAA